MSSGKIYFGILCWVFMLHVIGMVWFTKGFLLKRLVIEQSSECTVNFTLQLDPETSQQFTPSAREAGFPFDCWLPRRFDKAIIIIIDALRFDFVYFNESITENDIRPFQNKLPVIHKFVSNSPENAKLYKFLADPPTTTMQRLKGLTTGSLPTFVDASSNFATSQITEDNFIAQLFDHGKSLIFMGDDTWMDMYGPKYFKRSYPYPSLNIMDLHSVDNGVIEHLLPEMHKQDWDVIVAHFLGVDHCGHIHGPNHPAMAEKLTQMDQVLRSVIKEMGEDSLLLLFGDHGMTRTGDHGGDSEDELESALFVYSPQQISAPLAASKKEQYQKIWQVDLVPTLSLLLGAPIPFSNLGAIITDLFTLPPPSQRPVTESPHFAAQQNLLNVVKALQLNSMQVHGYLDAYSSLLDEFPYVEHAELDLLLQQSNTHLLQLENLMQVEGQESEVLRRLRNLRRDFRKYLRGVKTMCQNVWARFDGSCMLLGGLTLGSGSLLLIYLYIQADPNADRVPVRVYTAVIASLWQVLFYLFLYSVGLGVFGLVASVSLGAPAIAISAHIIDRVLTANRNDSSHRDDLPAKPKKVHKDWNFVDLFALGCMLIYGASMLSNSFVVFEDRVLPFLFMSGLCVMWHRTVKEMYKGHSKPDTGPGPSTKKNDSWKFDLVREITSPTSLLTLLVILLCVLLRLGASFRACREEQWTCELSHFLTSLSNLADTSGYYKNFRYFLPVACLAALVHLCKCWLRYYGNLNGSSPMVLVASYGGPAAVLCVSFHWALQALPMQVLEHVPIWQQVLFARGTYLILFITMLCVIISPLMIYLVPIAKSSLPPTVGRSPVEMIPSVYRHVKAHWQDYLLAQGKTKTDLRSENRPPTVYGLGTVYSSTIVTLVVLLVINFAMLQGNGMAPAVVLHILCCYLLLEISATYIRAKTQGDKVENVPWSCVILWCHLSTSYYFNTGHQYSVTHIRWESSYIGFHGNFDNYAIPAILVTMNTFSAHILGLLALPLMMFWPHISGQFVFRYTPGHEKSDTQGEMVLSENSNQLRCCAFSIILVAMFYYSFKFFCATLAATIHRRHLMVWKIFAPHLVFEGATLLTAFSVLLLAYVLVLQIDGKVASWLQRLAKTS